MTGGLGDFGKRSLIWGTKVSISSDMEHFGGFFSDKLP